MNLFKSNVIGTAAKSHPLLSIWSQVHHCFHVLIPQINEYGSTEFFPDLCEVTANVFKMKKSIRSQVSRRTGDRFWVVEYDVILLFGGTELKAQIAWTEKVSHYFPR